MADGSEPKDRAGGYTVVCAGSRVEFWDDSVMLFSVPPSLAADQARREALAALWDSAFEKGRERQREIMKWEFCSLIGAQIA